MNKNNKKWRNAGLYALLLIVVLALASAFFDRQPQNQTTWTYDKFLDQVKSGQVERVQLSADRTQARFPARDGENVSVNLPSNDSQLIDILIKNNVDVVVCSG